MKRGLTSCYIPKDVAAVDQMITATAPQAISSLATLLPQLLWDPRLLGLVITLGLIGVVLLLLLLLLLLPLLPLPLAILGLSRRVRTFLQLRFVVLDDSTKLHQRGILLPQSLRRAHDCSPNLLELRLEAIVDSLPQKLFIVSGI